jgi:Carboxypeptidase regulatory-like domain
MWTRTIILLAGLTVLVIVSFLLFSRLVQPPAPVLEGDERPSVADEPEPEAPPPTVKASLGGIVVSHTGEPVPGATVEALVLGDDLWPVDQDAPVPASGVTGPKGRFSFPATPPGDYLLRAREGERVGFLPLVRVRAEEPREVVLSLLQSTTLAGQVTRLDGSPIAGARVTTDLTGILRPYYAVLEVPPPSLRDRFESKTGASGRFRISPLPGGAHDLKVSAPGMRDRVFHAIDAPAKDLDLVLYPARTVHGTIVWSGESAPEQIEVRAEPLGVTTGARIHGVEAEFSLKGLIQGQYEIRAMADGFAIARAEVGIETATEPDPVRLVLKRGTRFEGRVSDQAGRPITNATVNLGRLLRTVRHTRIEVAHRLETGKDGAFSTVVGRGPWVAWAEADGYRPSDERTDKWSKRFSRFSRRRADPPAEEVFRVGSRGIVRNFRLERNLVIRGLVRRWDGSPKPWAHIHVESVPVSEKKSDEAKAGWWWASDERYSTSTNRHGRFEVSRLEPGRRHTVRASMGAYGGSSTVILSRDLVFAEDQGTIEIEHKLPRWPEGTVRGRVVDAQGRGVPGAIVFLDTPIETGPDGRFERNGLPLGRGWLGVIALGYALGASREFEIEKDVVTTIPDIRLKRRGFILHGRVLDSRGDPIAGAWIDLRFWACPGPEAMSSADGTFELRALDRWGWVGLIDVSAIGHVRVDEIHWREPRSPLDIILPTAGGIQGVLARDCGPATSVTVGLRGPRWRSWRDLDAHVSSDGRRFAVRGVAPGSYEVRVLVTGRASMSFGEKTVAETPLKLGEIAPGPAGSIEGTLVGSREVLRDMSRMGIPDLDLSGEIGRGGRFRIDHVPPGTWTLRSMDYGYPRGPGLRVSVSAGQTTTIEFIVCK